MKREELDRSGVYILVGTDSETGRPRAYVGEAEVIKDRLKQHRAKEFWVSVIVFVSKDENLTKGHIKYLEGRLLEEARQIGRAFIEKDVSSGAKLPEADRADMQQYLARIRQLLPVLGSDLLTSVASGSVGPGPESVLICQRHAAEARGKRTPNGFVILAGSTAVAADRPALERNSPAIAALRKQMMADGPSFPKAIWLSSPKTWSSPARALPRPSYLGVTQTA